MTKRDRYCHICETPMEHRAISTTNGWGGYKFTHHGVEANVCPKCGEITFSAPTVKMLQAVAIKLSELPEEYRPKEVVMKIKKGRRRMSKLLSLLEDYECAVRDSIDATNALGRYICNLLKPIIPGVYYRIGDYGEGIDYLVITSEQHKSSIHDDEKGLIMLDAYELIPNYACVTFETHVDFHISIPPDLYEQVVEIFKKESDQ